MKKIVACTQIAFDPKEKVNTSSINLSKNTEILSVKVTKDNDKYCLEVVFSCPAEDYSDSDSDEAWCEFQFLIAKCKYIEIEIDNHQYIGSIDVEKDTYAVFYKKMQQIKHA